MSDTAHVDAKRWTPPVIEPEVIPPPPPNYRDALIQMRHILRGAQVVVDNNMLPQHLHGAIWRGAVTGLIEHLDKTLDVPENQVEVILQAITIQRAALRRAGL